MRHAPSPVAVCFFGITRSLKHTLPSITRHVLAPAARGGEARVYAHFFEQTRVENPRSGESGEMDSGEHRLLSPDWLELEAPDAFLESRGFAALKSHGDYWSDDFRSLRNLVHQLHSLDRVTQAVLADGIEVCLFCRPDLEYHDSLQRAVSRARRAAGPLVQLPYWQPWEGFNDRFAVATGRAAIAAYGQRIRQALSYCERTSRPLHAERLVEFALREAGVSTRLISPRASRVRIDGRHAEEDFQHPFGKRLRWKLGVDFDPLIRLAYRVY
jgi:hypothetical protein